MSRTGTHASHNHKQLSVFCSYSHKDQAYREQLLGHLVLLKRITGILVWHDREILPGQYWDGQIDEHLNSADIILLLVSSDFAASEYCWDIEAQRALERHEKGEAVVVPVIIRPVEGWHDTPLGKLQALPTDGKPVALWSDRDEAYSNVAKGLHDIINNWPSDKTYVPPMWIYWYLALADKSDENGDARLQRIAARLRKAANSANLEYVGSTQEENRWTFRSTRSILDKLIALHGEGKLEQTIDETVLALTPGGGALLRIESRIVANQPHYETHYIPETSGNRPLEAGFPPLVGGISFPLDNPIRIGFSLYADSSTPLPTPQEQADLQVRLGRYLNTFLVLDGDQINVNLSPLDDYCGVPPLLRHTELGRDMLAQDIVLKHHTAAQMHPCTEQGKAFWEAVEAISPGAQNLDACFRVWIVPGDAGVHEKSEDGMGHVTIEKLGLKVLCESDYESLQRYRLSQGTKSAPSGIRANDERVVDVFKQFIVPEIQREVSMGPRFGLLRQILSVMIMAAWIQRSQLGEALTQAGFIGSNAPEKYGLNTVDDEVLYAMKRLYLRMFEGGIWQYVRVKYDDELKAVEKRLYVAGGIAISNRRRP